MPAEILPDVPLSLCLDLTFAIAVLHVSAVDCPNAYEGSKLSWPRGKPAIHALFCLYGLTSTLSHTLWQIQQVSSIGRQHCYLLLLTRVYCSSTEAFSVNSHALCQLLSLPAQHAEPT